MDGASNDLVCITAHSLTSRGFSFFNLLHSPIHCVVYITTRCCISGARESYRYMRDACTL